MYMPMGTLCTFGREEFAAIAAALGALRHVVVWMGTLCNLTPKP